MQSYVLKFNNMENQLFLNPGSRSDLGITDATFPDGSIKNASNYCRRTNDGHTEAAWCFISYSGELAFCAIPFCPGNVEVWVELPKTMLSTIFNMLLTHRETCNEMNLLGLFIV